MGKKYIIEIEEEPLVRKSALHGETAVWRANGFNSLVFDNNGLDKLTPYTESDTESIRKEAYEQGYTDGRKKHEVEVYAIAYTNGKQDGYQKGINDAWEAARTLWNTPNRKEVFGHTTFSTTLTTLTAQETIEKIRQYEQEKEEEIRVGDEVEDGVANLIVLEINEDGTVSGFDDEGSIIHATPRKKTGRHFPEIAEVLTKMRGK